MSVPWCDAVREHVAHIARGCRSSVSHNPAVHEQAIEAALAEATQERQALLDLLAAWRRSAASPNASVEALAGDMLDECAEELEKVLRG